MPAHTHQSVFDTVAAHLLTQGRKSATCNGECRYRGPDGTKCAAGVMIPDDQYNPRFEGKRVNAIRYDFFIPALSALTVTQLDLLDTLQCLHDAYEPQDWVNGLTTIAEEWDLSPAVLQPNPFPPNNPPPIT